MNLLRKIIKKLDSLTTPVDPELTFGTEETVKAAKRVRQTDAVRTTIEGK
jgi:hypothetical protein